MEDNPNICVYCGSIAETDDHVPPKSFFPKPRPSTLITVRSCKKCNSSRSKDDEYFKYMLGIRQYNATNPAIKKLIPSLFRGLNYSSKIGFRKNFFKNTKNIEVQSQTGIYLGRHLAHNLNTKRILKSCNEFIRGLYYHELSKLATYDIVDIQTNFAGDIDFTVPIFRNILNNIKKGKMVTIDENVFSYQFNYAKEDNRASAWLLYFYKEVCVLGLTVPKEVIKTK